MYQKKRGKKGEKRERAKTLVLFIPVLIVPFFYSNIVLSCQAEKPLMKYITYLLILYNIVQKRTSSHNNVQAFMTLYIDLEPCRTINHPERQFTTFTNNVQRCGMK